MFKKVESRRIEKKEMNSPKKVVNQLINDSFIYYMTKLEKSLKKDNIKKDYFYKLFKDHFVQNLDSILFFDQINSFNTQKIEKQLFLERKTNRFYFFIIDLNLKFYFR